MRITEPLHNGLVTARDPARLGEGELQRADNTVYLPNDTGLHAAPAETQAVSGLGAAVTGLAHCAFDFVQTTCDLVRSNATVNIKSLLVKTVTVTTGLDIIIAPTTSNFIGLFKGATITGTNIQAGTTIFSVDSTTQITMSLPATGTSTPDLTFANAKFANVSAGASVSGSGIPAGATVASVGADGTNFVLTTGFEPTITGQSNLIIKADNLIIAQANGKYLKARPGATGTSLTFSDVQTGITEGTALDSVHYNNLHVLLNGKNDNRVLSSDGLTRAHGLVAVTASPTLEIVAGVWALKDGVGFYSYWTTEYDANNDVESDYSSGVDNAGNARHPTLIEITTIATQAVKITRPPRVNTTATHWRVYRSIKYTSTTAKSAQRENQFPNGYLIGQFELRDDGEQDTFTDGGGATSIATVAAGTATSGTVVGSGLGVSWSNPNNAIGAPDVTYAKLIHPLGQGGDISDWLRVPLELGGYVFAAISAPITGITVNIYGRRVSNAKLIVKATVNTESYSSTLLGAKTVPLTTGADGPYALGGTSDKWGREWDVSDFSSGRFCVRLYGDVGTASNEVWVDAVTVAVTYGESQEQVTGAFLGDVSTPFPGVTVSPYGFTISAGRNGQPPRATTGDIYQDSLFTNDVDDSSVARYSFPSRIDLFPAPYFLNFDTREQDEITLIRTVGNVAVVGLKHQLYRVNYLPRDTDAEFERGRAVEIVELHHGIAGRKAGVVFTMPSGGQALAYANNYGVFMTDGYRVRQLTSDLDWWGTVDLTRLDQCEFINNPELQALEFYYVPVDAEITAYKTKQLYFHYHPTHLKGSPTAPELKVSGPRDTAEQSSVSAGLPNGTRKVYVGTPTGTVNYIDRLKSVLDVVDFQTRSLVPAGMGNEWRANEVLVNYTLHDYLPSSPGSFGITALVTKTDATDRTSALKNITIPTFVGSGQTNPKSRRGSKTFIIESGQGMAFRIQPVVTGTGRCSFESIVVDGIGQGLENPT